MVDIFQLGRILHEKFPDLNEFDAPAIDLAMEDSARAQEGLHQIVEALK